MKRYISVISRSCFETNMDDADRDIITGYFAIIKVSGYTNIKKY